MRDPAQQILIMLCQRLRKAKAQLRRGHALNYPGAVLLSMQDEERHAHNAYYEAIETYNRTLEFNNRGKEDAYV